MYFEHSVSNPGTVASIYIGGPKKHTFDLQVPAIPVVLNLEKAYLEFTSYIPNEHKNIYDQILTWL
jgi:hypothetical protein